jgi:hypothetical protein
MRKDTEFLYNVINRTFEDVDIGEFVFIGGEPFLRGDLPQLLRYAYQYRNCVKEHYCLFTNCSIPPSDDLISVMKLYGSKLKVTLDNYGESLSPQFENLKKIFLGIGVRVDEHIYCGQQQYLGGWTDGNLTPYLRYSNMEARRNFVKCRIGRHGTSCSIIDGVVYGCYFDYVLSSIYGVSLEGSESFFSLYDTVSSDEIRQKWISLLDTTCFACKYHDPKYETRITAAQQLTKDELQHLRTKINGALVYSMTRIGIQRNEIQK